MNFQKKEFLKSIGWIILTAGLYGLVAHLGLKLATLNNQTSPVWPATGLAIGFVYVLGYRIAIGVFLGAFCANWFSGLELIPAFLIGCGNTLEAVVSVMLFNMLIARPNLFGAHARLLFSMLSMFLATAISATIGTLTLYFFSVIHMNQVSGNWITWWVGDTLGALLLVPFAYKIARSEFDIFNLKFQEILKIIFVFLFASFINFLVFQTDKGNYFVFFLFLPLLLTACWFQSGWIYVVSLMTSSYAIWRTTLGEGPFIGNSLNESLVHLQLFLASLGFTAVGLGSLRQERLSRRTLLALLMGWSFSAFAFHFFQNLAIEKDKSTFVRLAQENEEQIKRRLKSYIDLLESGASFYEASDHVSRQDWRLFTQRALTDADFEGLHGLGIIFATKTTKISEFAKQVNLQEDTRDFKIHPVDNVSAEHAVTHPETNFVITYIEPAESNLQAIGLNVATEAVRYQAGLRARDNGQATLTRPIQLVQDKVARPGFLIFFPLYKKGSILKTVEDRRKAFVGFIYAPVVSEMFFQAALGRQNESLNIKVQMPGSGNDQEVIYQAGKKLHKIRYEVRHRLKLAGTPFEVYWAMDHVEGSSSGLLASWVGFSGALCALFFAIMISSLEHLTVRSQQIADEKTKEALERRRAWQTLAEISPVGIYLTDEKGHCTYVNSTWCVLTGISLPDALGTGWMKAVHPDDIAIVTDQWNSLLTTGSFRCNYRFVKDGEPVYVVGQAVPIKGDQDKITGYIGTVQDVTDLHNQQTALMASSRMSSLGEMASGVAHEINNPLTIIIGKAKRLEAMIQNEPEQVEAIRNHTQLIVKTSHRISKIIRGLQAFARETSNEPFQPVMVQDLIQNTLELCRERFIKYDTELKVPSLIDGSICFHGREEQISQVLMNLLNNAFDAVQELPEKWVEIEVVKTDKGEASKLLIMVKDSGKASTISPEIEKKIFNPFFTTKDVGKGTGLGLSISKGIVEKHKGQLYLDRGSEHTRFVIELDLFKTSA